MAKRCKYGWSDRVTDPNTGTSDNDFEIVKCTFNRAGILVIKYCCTIPQNKLDDQYEEEFIPARERYPL